MILEIKKLRDTTISLNIFTETRFQIRQRICHQNLNKLAELWNTLYVLFGRDL